MSQEDGRELIEFNRKFKKAILDVLFSICETFYIHCMPHPGLSIGRRGLVDREKDEGIILVFGPYSTRGLSWDEENIYCEMQFNSWERLVIPYVCIARMFDKTGQVLMHWNIFDSKLPELSDPQSVDAKPERSLRKKKIAEKKSSEPGSETEKVIEVDFSRKKKD
jgi:hypothetical protein